MWERVRPRAASAAYALGRDDDPRRALHMIWTAKAGPRPRMQQASACVGPWDKDEATSRAAAGASRRFRDARAVQCSAHGADLEAGIIMPPPCGLELDKDMRPVTSRCTGRQAHAAVRAICRCGGGVELQELLLQHRAQPCGTGADARSIWQVWYGLWLTTFKNQAALGKNMLCRAPSEWRCNYFHHRCRLQSPKPKAMPLRAGGRHLPARL